MVLLLTIIHWILEIYYWILIIYVLGSWFPEFRKSKVYYTIHKIANPYMRIFRGLLVFGQMDFTPILGFMLYTLGLNYLGQMIATLS
ncbi:MAG: YggT family protein [Candidatus Izimaplasma sp.]|nr:YggT family protein [Candidatus Izimaplasma bacterium]